ncbi:nuclease-related domain-containing DEAD/DEAH box helicase [uncultured Massilia sp.]|uniref:nuclease-related domain-containing DEAD/DEAH box helicase n=1 Tax=uncultured Massilia sp. TaxID=169973 RepID=UPI002600FCB6|nr:nuclease-related domain-containing DEAD/DEAH box helicase [uncultured Massilia sp.]
MAAISPALVPLRMRAGHYRERDVLERLRDGLPAGFEIFHNIALHTLQGGRDRYGEIDIAVLAPNGALLLMEVKAGDVVLRAGQVVKLYGERECDVAHQVEMQRVAMQRRLQEARIRPALASCLVLPDYALGDAAVASIPRERIIDAARYGQMAAIVRDWLVQAAPAQVDRAALRRLLLNQFEVTPDLDAMRGHVDGAVRRLADGLATWVPRIEAPSGIFRIQGTAGSGKTQLALRLLEDAAAAGLKAGYVCYNRALADHVRRLAPARAEVVNYHALCVEHCLRSGAEPAFSPDGFRRMEAAYVAASAGFAASLDLLVVDEGQDFDADWVQSLCSRLQPDGRLYLLEDDAQRLYRQAPFDLPGAVAIRCSDNFRSPQRVCDTINALGLVQPPIRAHNPYAGDVPGVRTYRDDAGLLAALEAAVADLLARGFAVEDIAVVCCRGRGRSLLLHRATLGPHPTRRFTGEYDRDGEPRWSDGQLLVESVYRYKGQSAPAVVVAEFDFPELDETARRNLFVALTRARMAVELVLSEAAEQGLAQAFARAAAH